MERFGGGLYLLKRTGSAYFPPQRDRAGIGGLGPKNIVCLEHFRRPRGPGWRVGRFGWVKA
jgi:hypothetical protein